MQLLKALWALAGAAICCLLLFLIHSQLLKEGPNNTENFRPDKFRAEILSAAGAADTRTARTAAITIDGNAACTEFRQDNEHVHSTAEILLHNSSAEISLQNPNDSNGWLLQSGNSGLKSSVRMGHKGQLAAGTCEVVTYDRDSSQPRRTIARQTARCACRKGQIAGTTRARPACVDARIIRTKQWCDMLPCLEGEGCDLLINKSGWTCTQPGGRIKTTTVS